MSGLDDLPEELLSRICDQLILIVPNHKQFSLLRINKRLYRILLPLVWRNIAVIDRRRLHRKFCAALVLRKNIASFVETISIVSTDPEDDGRAYGSKRQALAKKWGLNDEHVVDQLAARAAEIFGNKEELCEQWRKGIELQDTAFMIPLMLVHLPNLKRLRMNNDADFTKTWENLGVISEHMLGDDRISMEQKPFSKIRDFVLDAEIDNHGHFAQPLSVAALWPSLESLRAHCIASSEGDDSGPVFFNLPPRSTNLSTIQLFPMCQIRPSQIRSLVSASRGLRVFQYCIGLAWEWSTIEIDEIQKSLDLRKETLEDLTLCLQLGELEYCNENSHHFHPMDFTRYSRLTHLCLGAAFLYDRWAGSLTPDRLVKCLPACIQVLRIVHVENTSELSLLEDCIIQLFQHKSKFPDLEELAVGVVEKQVLKRRHKMIRASIESAAMSAGVRVHFFAYVDPDSERGSLLSQMGLREKEKVEEEEESDASSVVSLEDPDDDGWITGAEHSSEESEDDDDQGDDDDNNDEDEDDDEDEDGDMDQDDQDSEGQIEDEESQGDDGSEVGNGGDDSDADTGDEGDGGSGDET